MKRFIVIILISIYTGLHKLHAVAHGTNINTNRKSATAFIDPCLERYHCDDGINASNQTKECACDDLCHAYGDCCANKANNVNVAQPDILHLRLIHFGYCKEMDGYSETVYVLNSCPLDYASDDIRKACEEVADDNDILLQVPVSESRFGIVFSNLYCAMCHGWSRNQVTFWSATMACEIPDKGPPPEDGRLPDKPQVDRDSLSKLPANEIITQTICKLRFSPAEHMAKPRRCQMVVSTCGATWDNKVMEQNCRFGYTAYAWPFSEIPTSGLPYKNKYCAECNAISTTCQKVTGQGGPRPGEVVGMESISILLDFNKGQSAVGENDKSEIKTCAPSHVYDFIKEECRLLLCGPGFILQHDQCVKSADSSDQVETDLGFNETDISNCTKMQVREGKYMSLPDGSVFINASDIIFLQGEYRVQGSWIEFCTHTFDMRHKYGQIAVCAKIEVEEDNFVLLPDNSVYVNKTDAIFHIGEYVLVNNSVLVCAYNLSQDYTYDESRMLTASDVVQGVVSFVGQIISITALCLLLFIYSTNKPLRTVPGKCLMCLALSLSLAQFLFIMGGFSREAHGFCKAVAILTHFCFLASFFWMNVMAFDVWRTFNSQFSYSSGSDRHKKFTLYIIYATMFPAILVIISIIFDHIDSTNVPKPCYGKGLCWINNGNALFYMFALPVFILLGFNAVFFVLAVYSIYKAVKGTAILRQKKSGAKGKRLVLYIKLSSIMGLTWIFGFVAAFTGSTILWYLFVIFNALQGLFICIAFIGNRKVARMVSGYSERLSSAMSNLTQSTRLSSRSSRFSVEDATYKARKSAITSSGVYRSTAETPLNSGDND